MSFASFCQNCGISQDSPDSNWWCEYQDWTEDGKPAVGRERHIWRLDEFCDIHLMQKEPCYICQSYIAAGL